MPNVFAISASELMLTSHCKPSSVDSKGWTVSSNISITYLGIDVAPNLLKAPRHHGFVRLSYVPELVQELRALLSDHSRS